MRPKQLDQLILGVIQFRAVLFKSVGLFLHHGLVVG
jgi:hypothetical protein